MLENKTRTTHARIECFNYLLKLVVKMRHAALRLAKFGQRIVKVVGRRVAVNADGAQRVLVEHVGRRVQHPRKEDNQIAARHRHLSKRNVGIDCIRLFTR